MRAYLLVAGSLFAALAVDPALADDPASSAPAVEAQAPETAPADPAAAEAPGPCAAAETPVAKLVCRDPALTAASAAMERALAALGETTDDIGRAAIEAGQTLWRSRRDESCPVAADDLSEPKALKSRTDCVLRAMTQRTAALVVETQARARPVADLPLTVSGAAALRLPPIPPRPTSFGRPISAAALVGRWAKADAADRETIDDCRNSYLDVGRDLGLHAVDPRLPMFPLDGRLAADGDPVKGLDLLGDGEPPPPQATLRLVAGDTPRFDRMVLRLAPPATFAAVFLRCR